MGFGRIEPLKNQDQQDKPSGLAAGIVKEAARRKGIRLNWVHSNTPGIPALINGEADLWVSMVDTPERRRIIHITDPFLITEYSFFVLSDSPYRTWTDLTHARISLPNVEIYKTLLRRVAPDPTTVTATTYRNAWHSVIDGKADAVFIEQFNAAALLFEGGPREMRPISVPLPRISLGVASTFPVGPVADEIREEIKVMTRDGSLARLSDQWGYFPGLSMESIDNLNTERREERMLSAVAAAAVLILILSVSLFRSRRQQRRLVAAESAVRQSEAYYKGLVGLLPDTLYSVDRTGAPTAPLRDGGWRQTDVALSGLLSTPEHLDSVKRVIGTGEMAIGELRLPSGMFVEYRLIPALDGNGRVSGAMGILRDQTERRRAEEKQLELEDRLRSARQMETLGRLAGGVAHDFNNLLTVINGYSSLILADLEGHPSREHVVQVAKAGEQAAEITNQLLTFSRKQIVAPGSVLLNAVIEDISRIMQRLIGDNVTLTTVLEPSLRPILADAGQLKQMLLNLASNARDAMSGVGDLTIRTSNLAEAPAGIPSPCILLSVADTGQGMNPDVLEKIFEPFFTTKEIGHGTGLGLAMVHGIVHQAGGHIDVRSEPGAGTEFRIYFPAVDLKPELASAELVKPSGDPGSASILVTEDQDVVRQYCAEVLQSRGYSVLLAASGEEALEIAKVHSGKLDLLLTDVVMPGMSGCELAEKLIGERPTMKLLYMSGFANDALTPQGGIDVRTDCLTKPFSPDALLCAVQAALAN